MNEATYTSTHSIIIRTLAQFCCLFGVFGSILLLLFFGVFFSLFVGHVVVLTLAKFTVTDIKQILLYRFS